MSIGVFKTPGDGQSHQEVRAMSGRQTDLMTDAEDLSGRLRAAQEKLRESEERFRGTFEQAAVGIAHVSMDGRYLRVNDKLCEITGYTREELLGMTFMDLTLPEELTAGLERARALAAGVISSYSVEKHFRRKNGETIWINLVTNLVRTSEGVPRYFNSVTEDITPRKNAEFRLNRLHSVLSKTGDAVMRAKDKLELYQAVCRIVVEDGLLRTAYIAEHDSKAGQAWVVAACGVGQEYLRGLELATTEGQLSLGPLLRSGTYDVCNNIARDPRMESWREIALQLGICAKASFRINLGGSTTGALILRAAEADYFKEDEIELMHAVADHLSFKLQALQQEEQRLQAESALRESEGRFRGMFVAAATGIAITTPQGRFLSANEAYCKMLGCTEEELRARDFASLTHPEDLALNLTLRDELLAGKRESFVMEKRYLQKSGGIVWIRASVSTTRTTAGEITSMIVVAEDITQRKLAENALRQSEERFRLLSMQLAKVLDCSLDVICSFDAGGTFLQVSAASEKIWGYRPEELIGTSYLDRVHPEDRLKTEHAALEVRAGRPTIGFENRCLRKDGTITHIMWSAGWSKSDQSMFCVARDNNERRKLEEQFLRAQRMESIGALAGGIAHDLNNVLAPILMSIDLLRLPGPGARTQSILTTIEASARRGAGMVQQILSFARGVEEPRAVIHAGPIIRDIQNLVMDTFPKNIRFHLELAQGLPPFIGDPTQMHQVLLNLCVNARDAMPAGGSITLSAKELQVDETQAAAIPGAKPGPYVQIKVEDSGGGIPPDVLDKIFAPFFTTKEHGKGTGLGLSTVLGIVKNHDGFLRVESAAGQGTAFTICLPAHPASSGPVAAKKEQMHPHGNGELILVVDDEAAVRAITEETLESFGYRVLTAADGTEAVALYARHQADVAAVFTDLMMPVMDGPATIQVLRQMNPEVKIIAASGQNAEGSAAKVAEMGVNHFLPKPYTSLALLMMLERSLNPAACESVCECVSENVRQWVCDA